mgnify:CR=1 FL=1
MKTDINTDYLVMQILVFTKLKIIKYEILRMF